MVDDVKENGVLDLVFFFIVIVVNVDLVKDNLDIYVIDSDVVKILLIIGVLFIMFGIFYLERILVLVGFGEGSLKVCL